MESRKLLVLSDTHGHLSALNAVLNWAKDFTPPKGNLCGAAFLGDGISDLRRASDAVDFSAGWIQVRGNNDYGSTLPETTVLDFADHRFFMSHGHRHHLYGNYQTLTVSAQKNEAGTVLFGHTHVPFNKTIDDILLINPGSVGRPRSRIGATFAVIECIPGEKPKVEFWGIADNESIIKLKLSSI